MAYLYYENLSDVHTKAHAEAIMWGVLTNLSPYFRFIDSVRRVSRKKVLSIEVEEFPFKDLISEELALLSEEDYDKSENLDDLLNREEILMKLNRQLRKVIKIMKEGKGLLYQMKETDSEEIDRIKLEFLGANEIYLTRSVEDARRVKVLTTYPSYDLLVLDNRYHIRRRENSFRIYLRSNLYQLNMIRRSLEILQNRPMEYNRNLIRLLENIKRIEFDELGDVTVEDNEWIFLQNSKREGTITQREFVEISLNTPDFAILEGPPGSGKTTAICEIIYQAIKRNQRILLVASTHVAVDNVLEKLMDEQFKHYEEIRKTVLPIRIGRSERISDLATKYHVDSFWDSEKKRIREFLEQVRNRTESQELMLELLRSQENEISYNIRDAFIRAANLVCGTTIGILQHPEIRRIRRGEITLFPYDLLILDEASKTTFQEFMVPALVAKKFIVVGDIRQLPPYVEEEGITSNLSEAGIKEGYWVTLINNIRNAESNTANTGSKYIVQLHDPLNEQELENLDSMIPSDIPWIYLVDLDRINTIHLLGSTIIIGTKEILQKIQQFLPLNVKWVNEQNNAKLLPLDKFYSLNELDSWKRSLEAVKKFKKPIDVRYANDDSFESAIGYRLIRDFELRFNKENTRYKKEIEQLIPNNWSNKEKADYKYFLDELRRLAFPSIIELLQQGFERSKYQQERDLGSCLTDGLPKNYRKTRHRILEFQHRMHPQISSYPRKTFYNEKALRDLPGIEHDRQLNYDKYSNAALWIDVRVKKEGKNKQFRKDQRSNPREAQVIISELRDLINPKKFPPRKDGRPWEVAVLPFYKAQERLLRGKLQKLMRSNRKRTFYNREKTVCIELCVVDRFQGHEADIVFLSLVRNSGIGFLDTPNRLNVALTRARYQLLVVGDRKHFNRSSERYILYQNLAQEIPYKQYYRD